MNQDAVRSTLFQVLEMIEDVGLEPGITGPAAAALVDQLPALV